MYRKIVSKLYPLIPESLLFSRNDQSNIAIFAARRGGSSILSELIGSSPGVREVDQPLDIIDKGDLQSKIRIQYLPEVDLSQYFDLDQPQTQRIDEYLQQVLTGGLKLLAKPHLSKKSRVALKIVNAPFLADYLISRHNLSAVYISRHPAAQALSVMRNNWGITVAPYLRSEHRQFMLNYFTREQLEFAEATMQTGTYFQQAILNWVFENIYPLKFATNIAVKISYENLITNSEEVIELLEQKLDLQIDSTILNSPSRSSPLSTDRTKQAVSVGDKAFLVNRWKEEITEEQIGQMQEILSAMGIGEYK